MVDNPAGKATAIGGGKGHGRSASASNLSLPSATASAWPARRCISLCSADRGDASQHWQTQLRHRLGPPGAPPGPDVLPSLYDKTTKSSGPAGGCVAASGVSRTSAPPSTVGPSASVVAWFAQFRCASCSRIPTALDARFCFDCGQPLPLPAVLGAGGGGSNISGSRQPVRITLADVAAQAAERIPEQKAAARPPPDDARGGDVKRSRTPGALGAARLPGSGGGAGNVQRPRSLRARTCKARSELSCPSLSLKQRESEVSVWLGNVGTRR